MIAIEQADEELVGSVLAGNRENFAVLVDRYKRGIANFIGAERPLVGRCRRSHPRNVPARVRAPRYLQSRARTIFDLALSHRAQRRAHVSRQSLAPAAAADLGEDRSLEKQRCPDLSVEADPAGGVLRAEAEAEVRAALAELPERTRTVLALRYYDNMDYQSIATTMGLSLGNVKTLIHRGKLALAHKLKEREEAATQGVGRSPACSEASMNCSSTESASNGFSTGNCPPHEHVRVIAHVDALHRLPGLLEELRVVDALLTQPREVQLAPNFTFATMAEARAVHAPAPYRAPVRAYLVSYLAAAWLIAGAAMLFAPQTMRALGGTLVDIARTIFDAVGGLGTVIARLLGRGGNVVTAALLALLVIDILLVAGFGFALRYLRPRLVERLRS